MQLILSKQQRISDCRLLDKKEFIPHFTDARVECHFESTPQNRARVLLVRKYSSVLDVGSCHLGHFLNKSNSLT